MNDYEPLDALNGHPLRVERCRHNLTQAALADKAQVSVTTIWRAEKDYSISAASRQQLCSYFNKTSQELGLNGKEKKRSGTVATQKAISLIPLNVYPNILVRQKIKLDIPSENVVEDAQEQAIGEWLALESCNLAALFETGWTVDSILGSLRIILQSVEGMPLITRRKLLQLSGVAATGSIMLPQEGHISQEEQIQFTQAMGSSITRGWMLFNTIHTSQVLTIAHALLSLVQQNCFYVLPSVRPLLYSSAYRLIGAALHFHGCYNKAYQTHEHAYISALEGSDIWNMVQCRIWQVNGLMEQKQYNEALQLNETVLCLMSYQDNLQMSRLKAKILASSAEAAAFLGESKLTQERLNASKLLLEQFPQAPHEEFDYLSWHQSMGVCALILGHPIDAINELQQAVDGLPTNFVLRNITALMPLAIAYARIREREKCLETATKVIQRAKELNAPSINQQFSHYIREEIQKTFHDDPQINALTCG